MFQTLTTQENNSWWVTGCVIVQVKASESKELKESVRNILKELSVNL